MKRYLDQKYINVFLHVLIWSGLLLLPYLISTGKEYYVGPIPGVFFSIANLIHLGIFYLNAFYLYPKLLNKKKWWLYILSIILLILISFKLKHSILTLWFPEVLQNYTSLKFVFGPSIFFLVISIAYRRVIDKIKFEREQKEKRAEQLSTELKFLRSQISPHFLFNVLTNLVSLARKKSDQLEPSLLMLSDLMRYMLYDSMGEKVLLQKEIEYLKSYIELQRLRFGDEVEIETFFEYEKQKNFTIEPMLLIPFVENAFKHGIGWIEKPFINIRLKVDEKMLAFTVINKIGKEKNESKDDMSGIGLSNVQSRLNLLYSGKHELMILTDKNLFTATLSLDLL